jgi:uncharacterized SAM-binding protein YcdF (DUF218 family)
MEIWLKEIIPALLLPLPITLILLVIGLIFLWFTRYKRTGTIFVTIGFFILLIFSLFAPANFLLSHLELKYKPIELSVNQTARQIVVLGGGLVQNIHHKQSIELSSATLSRLITGISVAKQIAHSRLILSGGEVFGLPPEATAMEKVAEHLGFPSSRILLETKTKDTHQQAIELKKLLGKESFILVTSAIHMPRAMAIFHHYGLNPIPYPTQYLGNYTNRPIYQIYQIIPNTKNLGRTDIAVYEYLGVVWARLNGYL